jgi:hypothetical protein
MPRYVSGLRSSRAGSDEGSSIESSDSTASAKDLPRDRSATVAQQRRLSKNNRIRLRSLARHAASSPPLPKPAAPATQFKAGVRDLPGVTTRASNPRPQLPPSIIIGTLTMPSSPLQPRGGNKRPGSHDDVLPVLPGDTSKKSKPQACSTITKGMLNVQRFMLQVNHAHVVCFRRSGRPPRACTHTTRPDNRHAS